MLRAFAPFNPAELSCAPALADDEIHHLCAVRRLKPNEPVELLNGTGSVAFCHASSVARRSLQLELISVHNLPPPRPEITLCIALPKPKVFANVLARCTELGVAHVIPLQSTNADDGTLRALANAARWHTVLVEAIKQSGNPWLPTLHPALTPAQALAQCLQPENNTPNTQHICAALHPKAKPLTALPDCSRAHALTLWIGPEGDFSPDEYALFDNAGLHFLSLGPLVLRVETAVTGLIAALRLNAPPSLPS